jgi:hypothetical protein
MAIASAAIVIAASVVEARETTLDALDACPAGSERVCLPFPFRLAEDPKRFGFRRRPDDAAGRSIKLYAIKGRLAGGTPKQYQLRVFQDSQDSSIGSSDPGALPYRGRSAQNRPIILTDRGPLEVLTKGFDADFSSNMYVIDHQRWRAVGAYATVFEPRVTVTHGRVSVWLKNDQSCVSAPTLRPGALRQSKTACSKNDSRLPAKTFFENPENLDRVLRIIPGLAFLRDGAIANEGTVIQRDHGYAVVEQLPGTNYIVVTTDCDDCY